MYVKQILLPIKPIIPTNLSKNLNTKFSIRIQHTNILFIPNLKSKISIKNVVFKLPNEIFLTLKIISILKEKSNGKL